MVDFFLAESSGFLESCCHCKTAKEPVETPESWQMRTHGYECFCKGDFLEEGINK